ncbi:MAG: beta-phosphoglucomutase [Bacillota bacterium]
MEKLKYEAVIFDLDGVIVDTAKYHFLAWKRLAKELDIEFTKEDNERLKGVSRMRCMDIILELGNKEMSDKRKKELTDKKNNWYLEYVNQMDESEILPGALELIEKLVENDVKIAIGSASKNAKTILKKVNLIDKFKFISDGTVVTKAKPDPEVFTLAADKLDVEYDKCVVFEDSQAGIDAANSVNMLSIAIGESKNLDNYDYIFNGVDDFDFNILYK